MDRKIRIKITKDGKVEVDSSIFKDCMEIADQLKRLLGDVEKIDIKNELEADIEEKIKIDKDD